MKERAVKNLHKHCLLPDGTELQEHSIKTQRNIVVGEFCQIDYGLRGADVYVGESSKIREYIWANGDVRIGNWCEVGNDVIARENAYIGEGVKIAGKLVVSGALDIGEKVEIREGFEAKGDVEVRNPMPVFMFIIIYLMTLLKIENEKELDRILDDLFSEEHEKIEIKILSVDEWQKRFNHIIKKIHQKASQYSLEEIETDIAETIKEVRAEKCGH